MTAPVTIRLSRPIELRRASDGAVLSSQDTITLRPPTLGDMMEAVDAGGAKRGQVMLHLAARLSGLSVRDLAALPLADGEEVMLACEGFSARGRTAGETPSPPSPAPSASPPTGEAGDQAPSTSGQTAPAGGLSASGRAEGGPGGGYIGLLREA